MSGWIDLHTHLLPGLDDGAESVEEAVQIAKAAADAGFSMVAATPHRIEGVYFATNQMIVESLNSVKAACNGMALNWTQGAEYYLDDRFLAMLESGPLFCLGDSDTVLVELPMMRLSPFFGDFAFRIRLKGYRPLLAHPERYNDIMAKPKRALELIEKGYLLQVNLGSFAGIYGRRVAKTARFLVEQGWATVAASDVHEPKRAKTIYGDGLKQLKKTAGESGLVELLRDGPKRMLTADREKQL